MAIELELDTGLKVDGEFYEEGTPATKLPKKARDAARAANAGRGVFRVQRVDDTSLAEALAELDAAEDKVELIKADQKQAKVDEKNAEKVPTAEDPLSEEEIKAELAPESEDAKD